MLMYAQDYDEMMPIALIGNAGSPGNVHGNARYWMELVAPYCKNFQLFRCASDASPWIGTPGAQPYLYTSYGYNLNYLEGEASANSAVLGQAGRPLSIQQSPSEKVMLCDSESCASGGISAVPAWTGDALGFGNDVAIAGAGRHNGGVNVAYCDGHAKWNQCAATAAPWPQFVTDLWKWQVNND